VSSGLLSAPQDRAQHQSRKDHQTSGGGFGDNGVTQKSDKHDIR